MGRGVHHGRAEASRLAWVNRWEPWPVHAQAIQQATDGTDPLVLRFAYWCAARRLHFAFAHSLLHQFCAEAVDLDGPDEFLELLGCSGAVVAGDDARWGELEQRSIAVVDVEPDKALHVLLTTIFTAREAPRDVLARALTRAQKAAERGDVVAAYRVVSLLRQSGDLLGAFTAVESACCALAENDLGEDLGNHLSERLLVERQFITEALRVERSHRRR